MDYIIDVLEAYTRFFPRLLCMYSDSINYIESCTWLHRMRVLGQISNFEDIVRYGFLVKDLCRDFPALTYVMYISVRDRLHFSVVDQMGFPQRSGLSYYSELQLLNVMRLEMHQQQVDQQWRETGTSGEPGRNGQLQG